MPTRQEPPQNAVKQKPASARLSVALRELLGQGPWPRVLIAVIAGGSVLFAGLVVYLSRDGEDQEDSGQVVPYTVADALTALDRGNPLRAQRMAGRLAESAALPPDDAGGPAFIFGLVAAGDAERLWGRDQIRYFRLAARYLEQSQTKGFPAGREAEGLFLLGKSLLMCGDIAKSRSILEAALEAYAAADDGQAEAIKADPDGHGTPTTQAPADHLAARRAELHRLLVTAYTGDPQPNLDRALFHVAAYLAEPALSRNDRSDGLLARAEIMFRLQQDGECRKVLTQIDPETEAAIKALLIEGEMLMREGAALAAGDSAGAPAKAKYEAAIASLLKAQNRGADREAVTRRSMYLIGRCRLAVGDLRAALDDFRRTRELYPETPEGLAAALEEADLAGRMGQEANLVEHYIELVRLAGSADAYSNTLLPLDALRARLLSAYQRFLETGNFAAGVQFAEALYPLFAKADSLTLVAQTESAWAQSLEQQAARLAGDTADAVTATAHAHRRQAAAAYATLAGLRFATDHYTEDVWNSAENYLRGQDFAHAETMLHEYLKYELRKRRPRALLDLGDVQLSLGRPEQALITLQECIEVYPRDPASYRARLVAARAQIERRKLADAKHLLLFNLEGTELDPDSVEWRDSLFALGMLLHDEAQIIEAQSRQRRAAAESTASIEETKAAESDLQQAKELYQDAVRRLEEAVARYPNDDKVVETRYTIAESLRALARFAREKLELARVETSRLEHRRELHRLLTAAVAEYEQVQDILTRRRERSLLSPSEKAILRNCYFARGAAFYQLGRFADAIAAYAATTNRYHDEPEVLDAFMQLAQCYRQLEKLPEARGVIEQAKAVLAGLPADADFSATIHSRDEWARALDWAADVSRTNE
jgi:TolA-binding protein